MKNRLLSVWDSDLKVSCHGHYEAAVALEKKHYYFGVPIVVLSGIAGTSVFATLAEEPHVYAKIAVGLVSLLVAVLGALQTFLRLSERAEKHRESGAKFGALLKEIEQYQLLQLEENEFRNWADGFRQRWDELSAESPTIPKSIYQKHHKIQKTTHNKKMQPTAESVG